MGHKDHLGTPEEDNRRRQRDLKKVTSTAYQGNPPVFTEGLDQVGLKARTTGEVRDTDFPILFNIDDQTLAGNLDQFILDLSTQSAMFHRIIIGDVDNDTNPILNIDVLFDKLPKGKELQFTIEFIKDLAIVIDPTITFSPPLQGIPANFPDAFDVWYFLISGRTLKDDTTRFELLNVGTGSGGGNTFPILYPEENLGLIGFVTQIITVSGSDGQFKEITMNGDVDLVFQGLPAGTVLEEWWILFIQDGAGGHGLTSAQGLLKNAGLLNSLIDKTANARTLFHFATGDGGTSIHGDLVDLTAAGGGFSGLLSDLVIDVNKDWNGKSINNLAGLDLFANAVANAIFNVDVISFISNAASSRGQFGRSDFFGTAQGLTSNIMAGDNWLVAVDNVEKFRIDSALQEVRLDYTLNMKGNLIILDAGGNTSIGSPFLTDNEINLITNSNIRIAIQDNFIQLINPTTVFGNLSLIGGDLQMGGGNIIAGGIGTFIANVGHIDFIDVALTPVALVSLYSDGVTLFSNSNINMNIGSLLQVDLVSITNTTGLIRGTLFGDNTPATVLSFSSGERFRISNFLEPIADFTPNGLEFVQSAGFPSPGITKLTSLQFAFFSGVPQNKLLITANAGDVTFNLDANDDLIFQDAGVEKFKYDSFNDALDFSIRIEMNNNNILGVAALGFNAANTAITTAGGMELGFPSGELKVLIAGIPEYVFRTTTSGLFINDNSITGIQALGFTDAGGQINVDLNVMQFVTTSPSAIMRFTPQGNNTLDITEDGLIMNENINLQNNDILRVNRLEFDIAGQVIFDGNSALTIEVGANDTIDFVVNSNPTFQVNDNFCDFFDSFWDMTQRLGPIFPPPVNQRRVFVNPATEELSVIRPDTTIVSLETGGGGGYNLIQDEGNPLPPQTIINFVGAGVIASDGAGVTTVTIPGGGISNQIVDGNSKAIVNAETFQVFTNSIERFNINPSGLITLISSGEINMIGNVNMLDNKIFDVNTIEFKSPENITLDNTKALITSEFDPTQGPNGGTSMIFNVPGSSDNTDFFKFFSGTFPNNPILTMGRNFFQYITAGTLSGSTVRFISEQITLQVGGVPGNAKINFLGSIGTNIIPLFGQNLSLGTGASTAGDSEYWNKLFVKNINFTAPLSSGNTTSVNIHVEGENLLIETGQLSGNVRDIRFNRTVLGGGTGTQFARFTDDEDVFTPKDLFVISVKTIINNSVVLGSSASDLITINGLTSINEDLNFDANKTIDWDVATFSPTANAGGATLPSNPLGFLFIKIDGANAKIPFYGV